MADIYDADGNYIGDSSEFYDTSPGGLAQADTGKNNSAGIWGALTGASNTAGQGIFGLLGAQSTNKSNAQAAKIKAAGMAQVAIYVVFGLIVVAAITAFARRRKSA